MPRHLPPEQVMRAVTLLEEGHTQRYVAEQLGMSQSVFWRLWQRYRELHTVQRQHESGRKRKTTPAEDRFVRLLALPNWCSMARDLRGELINAHGTVISIQTVRNRLREGQIKSQRPLRVPRLQPHHRIGRLHFAREHVEWQLRHWTPVFFSDESDSTFLGQMVILGSGDVKGNALSLPLCRRLFLTEADRWWSGEEFF